MNANQNSDLTVVTFCWGRGFNRRHVNALRRAVAAQVRVPHRFVCVTDQEQDCETLQLWPQPAAVEGRPSNFNRLRLFDADTQRLLGKRVVQMDLDGVLVDDLTPLVTCKEEFRVMDGTRQRHQQANYYNGSLWVHDLGARQNFWDRLMAEGVAGLNKLRMPDGRACIGSDQAWMAYCSTREAVFTEADGLFQYRSLAGKSPDGARAVFFAGRVNPWDDAVASEQPRLRAVWDCYDRDRVKAWSPAAGDDAPRALLLGVGPNVWQDVQQARPRPTDVLIAFPEAALVMDRQVDALALNFQQAERVAKDLGCDEKVVCGAAWAPKTERYVRTGRGSVEPI